MAEYIITGLLVAIFALLVAVYRKVQRVEAGIDLMLATWLALEDEDDDDPDDGPADYPLEPYAFGSHPH